ncbi:MAG TPA: hypothetical protein VNG12_21530 [Acidimicrobiales bacterium]|nr:hypothetical protein [Acidimicrobiales bacterium]
MTRKVRWALWPVLVIGLAMIVAPLAISLPSKASAGQQMLNGFHPLMQPAAVATTVKYYDQTFTALGPVATGGVVASSEIPTLFSGLAGALHMTQPQLASFLSANYPALAQLLQKFPQLVPVFKNVPPGLAWYKPLVDTMQAQVSNYQKVDSLPNFNLFTWFFMVPGILLVMLSGFGLFQLRPRRSLAVVETPSGRTLAA